RRARALHDVQRSGCSAGRATPFGRPSDDAPRSGWRVTPRSAPLSHLRARPEAGPRLCRITPNGKRSEEMEPRINYANVAPGALGAMQNLERYVRECGLEHSLLHLVKLRASQINGCAYCVDMHSKDARAGG